MPRPTRPNSGRFDLIPAIAERRLALAFEQDAHEYGQRAWERDVPLGQFIHEAKDELNLLLLGDQSSDHAAKCALALLAFMTIESRIKQGRLPSDLNDMPEPEGTILVPPPIPAHQLASTSLPALPAVSEDEPPPPPPMGKK